MVVFSESVEGSSSSTANDYKYGVFLSFRGVDTRHGFIDHLHKALLEANISTFLDDEEIETGRDLKPELENAIKASRASIIVLSKNYANSSWCLDELVLILEQHRTSKQIVIPIFYNVEPTHVRKQESTFGDAMAEHKQKMEAEINANKRSHLTQKIDRWIQALTEVADLKGKNANGRRETQFIEEIVEGINRILHVPLGWARPLLFGMDSSIELVTSWLKDASSDTGSILTILGMSGIGKTSLAKHVYGLHSREFQESSHIEDISRRCEREKYNGLLNLQKQLYGDISNTSSNRVQYVSSYTSMIETIVANRKVFLVLDDIDSLDQLDALLGTKGFYRGSKIIITTKDAWLTQSCALFRTNVKPQHATNLLQGIEESASRNLLCFHAFMCNDPKPGYEKVSQTLVKYCEGHPLALEVLGKSLRNREVAYWEEWIVGIKKENQSPINNILKMSFDSLPLENDKKLFKHIACFFVGMDKDVTEIILKACGINTISGMTNLIERCLLSIGWNNKIQMHQLLQEAGRFVVRQESPDEPRERSRLWCHDEAFEVLNQKMGNEKLINLSKLIGVSFDMRMLEKETSCASFELETNALKNMNNLLLLKLDYLKIKGSFENFPKKLRWLCMHGFPLKYLPLDCPMEKIVVLDMSYSNIELFGVWDSNPPRLESRKNLTRPCVEKKKLLGSLKILNLSFCKQLLSLGGFEELPALEYLIVKHCISLLVVCESIKQCAELVLVDLCYCDKLTRFPRSMGILNKIETLRIEGCNLGEMLKVNKNTTTYFIPILEGIPILSKLFLIYLSRSLVCLSLIDNNLSTESFPIDFGCLSSLKLLYLDYNPIVTMPNCVKSFPKLEMLSMTHCHLLTSVEYPPCTLRELNIFCGPDRMLQNIIFDPEMSPLYFSMEVAWLKPISFEIQGMVKVQPMTCDAENVLRKLGWTNLDFLNKSCEGKDSSTRGSKDSEIQMHFEFGIFSTFYWGKDMPNFITNTSGEPSISFTIPSSPNNLIGLNFCSVQHMLRIFVNDVFYLPVIIISNVTKNRTWVYEHHVDECKIGGTCFIFLSHWMFGINEMESGDQVTITVHEWYSTVVTTKCGVSFVYDDGNTDKEEDVLGYYKSWNHIIGGDLVGFQLTTGEYYLRNRRFISPLGMILAPYATEIGLGEECATFFKEEEMCFKAFSQRKDSPPLLRELVSLHKQHGDDLASPLYTENHTPLSGPARNRPLHYLGSVIWFLATFFLEGPHCFRGPTREKFLALIFFHIYFTARNTEEEMLFEEEMIFRGLSQWKNDQA